LTVADGFALAEGGGLVASGLVALAEVNGRAEGTLGTSEGDEPWTFATDTTAEDEALEGRVGTVTPTRGRWEWVHQVHPIPTPASSTAATASPTMTSFFPEDWEPVRPQPLEGG